MPTLSPMSGKHAAYALTANQSKGRHHPEPAHAFRGLFERDRDRVVHSTAFRRLVNKTQVFPSPTNDHHRTRLTHTLEVAQISRVVARQIGLEEDLTEAIALAHDLGHPPFGHAGEDELRQFMKEHGGFEHNSHALRIVTMLEYRYPGFSGLNLSWEVREAFAHHSKSNDPSLNEYKAAGSPFLEAQVADEVDSLAYNAHDVEDALTAGLVRETELDDVPLWCRAHREVLNDYPGLPAGTLIPTIVRKLISWQVDDLIQQSLLNLAAEGIDSVASVRACPRPLISMSEPMKSLRKDLERFLHRHVYRHTRVQRMAFKGRRTIRRLFEEFLGNPVLLPIRYRNRLSHESAHRVICDYIAGMTDRYARAEFRNLFSAEDDT